MLILEIAGGIFLGGMALRYPAGVVAGALGATILAVVLTAIWYGVLALWGAGVFKPIPLEIGAVVWVPSLLLGIYLESKKPDTINPPS